MLSTKKEKERSVARAADLSAERSRAIFFNATTYHPSAFLVTRVSGWSPIDRLELRIYTVHGWWMKHAIQWNADYKIVGLGALDARVMIRRFSIVLRCPPYIYGVWNGFVGRGGTGIFCRINGICFVLVVYVRWLDAIKYIYLYCILRKMKFYSWGTRKLDSSLVIFNIFTWRSFLILKSGSFFFFLYDITDRVRRVN